MKTRWLDEEAAVIVKRYSEEWGEDLALRAYSSRLIGEEKSLVLHGGGNTSVKSHRRDLLGEDVPAVYVKASGHDLASISPEGFTALDLGAVRRLRALHALGEDVMALELLARRFNAQSAPPTIEALLHAFIPAKFIDHTHADAILSLTNQPDGGSLIREALGRNVIVLEYIRPGFPLARAAAEAFDGAPASEGMVLSKHGLVTWGESARESYERTIDLVTRAEEYLASRPAKGVRPGSSTAAVTARDRYILTAPLLRGLLAVRTGDADRAYRRFILRPLITDEVLSLVDSRQGKAVALTPPLTADHLIRTKPLPAWIDDPAYDDEEKLRGQLSRAIEEYASRYVDYVERHAKRFAKGVEPFDPKPRVVLMPGLGAVCAGADAAGASVVRDITARTLSVKSRISAAGTYEGLSEDHLFDMEYLSLQLAKLSPGTERPLDRSVALVTGAAGAIGAGICEELLKAGCHVAVSDLDVENLKGLTLDLKKAYGGDRVFAVPLDVTETASVKEAFRRIIQGWGGIDLIVANAGAAHVSALTELDPAAFQRLERVNVEGTLNVLAEAARHFKRQGMGGDIVVVSTKNVFSPGAKFGAYSATKAAAHQLARIASLELAEYDVRVNMVSPDAVFSHGERRSGLWEEIGPDRMKARGLDEKGLEEYYRNRNLLKARVTAVHVARAVLFFATRQTPTTGATLPVDGGLPDATPR
jgi:rhamnose utilization protein RhaD (predicted bifunctional aldolase and dehydrogenase)/NAD(P)-dependent dehydrogenase (short-subunit alcohol dehydrogenase family)